MSNEDNASKTLTPTYKDTLHFLYKAHETSFNRRREFEWRILVGAVSLLVAIDAVVLVNITTPLDLLAKHVLAGFCLVIGIVTGVYQDKLRGYDYFNREAMDEINNKLCDDVNLNSESKVRVPQPTKTSTRVFRWQVLVVAAVTFLSVLVPFITRSRDKEDKKPNQPCEVTARKCADPHHRRTVFHGHHTPRG